MQIGVFDQLKPAFDEGRFWQPGGAYPVNTLTQKDLRQCQMEIEAVGIEKPKRC